MTQATVSGARPRRSRPGWSWSGRSGPDQARGTGPGPGEAGPDGAPDRPGRQAASGRAARARRRVHGRVGALSGRLRRVRTVGRDAGMATAEYAVATLAACGFAGLLVTIMRSGEVRGLLLGIIRKALSVA